MVKQSTAPGTKRERNVGEPGGGGDRSEGQASYIKLVFQMASKSYSFHGVLNTWATFPTATGREKRAHGPCHLPMQKTVESGLKPRAIEC